LDSADFNVPATAVWTREKLVNYLLDKQNKDGGWAWDESKTSDIDTTSMILTAFAPYKKQENVKSVVDKGVQYLSKQYLGAKLDNSTTAAQVVIALSTLGINADKTLFASDKSSLLEYLLSFQKKDGGFGWKSGDSSDVVSTTQGFQALTAYQLYTNGGGSLFHLPLMAQAPIKKIVDSHDKAVPEKDKSTGHPLPDTATNSENLLVLGSLLLIIGIVAYLRQRKLRG
jgi:prenyltransferase beta subunit